MDFILWILQGFALAPYHLVMAILNPGAWLDWSNPEAVMRFIYYGGSSEFFFVVFTTFLVITGLGMAWKRSILWNGVIALEAMANGIGRLFAWAGLLMVIQQIVIVFIQRIFAQATMSFGFGTGLEFDISWWAEELKLYNAMVVCLCVTYTFVQGSHVRVDLVYSAVGHRTKRMIDMFGSIVFMMPAVILTYMYAWFFMWRHLVLPNASATGNLDRMIQQSAVFRWNVETIGFSPNGFNAYFLFKILIVIFCVLVFLQAVAFFWRSYLEWLEGEESAGKYSDKDKMGDAEAEMAAAIH